MKKFLPIAAAALLALSVTACSGGEAKPAPAGSASPAQASSPETTQAAQPISLDGTWIQVDADADMYQQAEIKGKTIEINWVSDGGKTKSLYWAGSVEAPTGSGAVEWASKNDTEKTSMAMLASSDDTKEFTVDNGVLSYEVSALGTTKTVELKRK